MTPTFREGDEVKDLHGDTGTVDHVDEDGSVWCYWPRFDAVLWSPPHHLTNLTTEANFATA